MIICIALYYYPIKRKVLNVHFHLEFDIVKGIIYLVGIDVVQNWNTPLWSRFGHND